MGYLYDRGTFLLHLHPPSSPSPSFFTFTLLLHLHPSFFTFTQPPLLQRDHLHAALVAASVHLPLRRPLLLALVFGVVWWYIKKKTQKKMPQKCFNLRFFYLPEFPSRATAIYPEKGMTWLNRVPETWPTHVEIYIFVLMRVLKTPRKAGKCLNENTTWRKLLRTWYEIIQVRAWDVPDLSDSQTEIRMTSNDTDFDLHVQKKTLPVPGN